MHPPDYALMVKDSGGTDELTSTEKLTIALNILDIVARRAEAGDKEAKAIIDEACEEFKARRSARKQP